jgi:hypothetical protein
MFISSSRQDAMSCGLAQQGAAVTRPALIFSRTLLDALADLRTATPIYLAALKVVPTIQQLANLIPSGRFVPAVTLEALRDARLYQSEIVHKRTHAQQQTIDLRPSRDRGRPN